jgi:hypothetical protein
VTNISKDGTEFLVNTQTVNDQVFPTIANLINGGFVVTWTTNVGPLHSNNGTNVEAQIFNAHGVQVGSEFVVNTNTAFGSRSASTIAGLTNGGFVISWQEDDLPLQISSTGS